MITMKTVEDLEGLLDAKSGGTADKRRTVTAEVVRANDAGTLVRFPGASAPTPVHGASAGASVGDFVEVTVDRGRAVLAGNMTSPSATTRRVESVSSVADAAYADAALARTSAESAVKDAAIARGAAASASQSATEAKTQAGEAKTAADEAKAKAQDASTAASSAQQSADSALFSLSEVQDVLGTLNWVSEHGTYAPTEDAAVVDGKVYYTRSGSGTDADPYVYSIVAEPKDSELPAYYELSIDEAVSNYIASHLALTGSGLRVMFDGTSDHLLIGDVDGVKGVYVVSGGSVMSAYSADGVTVGPKSGFHVEITGTELGFWQGAFKVAYITNNELYIPNTVVLNSMRLGEWMFKYREGSGNMGVFWAG